MTKHVLLAALLLVVSACSATQKSAQNDSTIYSFSQNITEQSLYNDLAVLAHDSLQGRETATPGEEKAAKFISDRYEEIGLQPGSDENTWFQSFDLIQPTVNGYEYTVHSISRDSVISSTAFTKEKTADFVTIFGGSDRLEGPVHFAGTGMFNPGEQVNHFPKDASGAWILVFYVEGQTNMQKVQQVLSSGKALGAIIMIGNDVEDYQQEAESRQQYLGQGRGLSLKYLQDKSGSNSPAFNRIHPELAAKLLGFDNTETLMELQQDILDSPQAFISRPLDVSLLHDPEINENLVQSKNVLGFLEGSDPTMRHEVVVLSSHYDHVGVGEPDSTGDAIYNGADDDGSGTAATIQVAEAMMAAKKAGHGPRRSVLFLNVSGEEKGLLGSRYYSDHPTRSIHNTIANINMDMIGRVDPEHVDDSSYVYIIGGEIISSALDSLSQMANVMGPNLTLSDRYNDLEDPNQFYRRSDHWNFGRLGVPFVFFFNGVHEDYHRPSDHIEKITFGPYTQRTRLIYNLTALLANSPERPKVDNQEFIEKTQAEAR
ncbi:M28 family peptidase [Gracilimonas mengyeensis]|uniref:Peptidase family M28 n=1 Tax=Gracilimonas mengyeensis TaxID=1302730 RepID=A0A521DG55_9BACT|nr:M28 family peptidase [Gracilimonas mengyeensis]SMO70111.1 Peptidase family M28 [Gracilimonas mengyeensis]